MKKWQKVFGILALVLGILSFTPFGSDFAWGALKPAAAILFGTYLICKLLAPEYAKYNEEQKERLAKVEETPTKPPPNEHTHTPDNEPYRPVGEHSTAAAGH
jgi:uncharacterized membrane protein